MKKFVSIIAIILIPVILSMSLTACWLADSNKSKDTEEETSSIKYPINSITLSSEDEAMPIGGSFSISAMVSPTYTDDTIVWSSTDESVLTIEADGNSAKVNVIGIGTAGIKAKAANGNIYDIVSFKIMPEYTSNYPSICHSVADAAILTIENKCYNTVLGIPSKSETITFKAVIFKQSNNVYHFITGWENFKKIDGYSYQSWTAIDYNGKKYDLNAIYYEKNYTLGYKASLAIGSINAYNLNALPISYKGTYYDKERLYVKTNSGSGYKLFTKYGTELGTSPMSTMDKYSNDLYGSPVLDCEYDLVGLVIGSDTYGNAEFVANWRLLEFIKSYEK